MEESCINMTLNCLTFMKDKTRKNVGVQQAIIYCSWLRSVNQRIVIIQSQIAAKMASVSNGNGEGSRSGGRRSVHGNGGGIESLVISRVN